MQPVNLFKYPKAILHIDGDCFFASCEVAKNPSLKGKAVVTGMERGIVSSLTYEAKDRGVKRAMSLPEVKKICPDAIFLPSDYETYSLYSMRMFNIVRRYTSIVEEYSIDECFADLTGMQRPLNMNYEKIAEQIKHDLDTELGMTFSIGLAPSKVLAKIASKWKKPSGLACIPGRDIHLFLLNLNTEKVWGIGPKTSAYLKNLGVNTALEFVNRDKYWIKDKLTKPHYEIWQELKGKSVYKVEKKAKKNYQSISKTKTFTPASTDNEFVFSQLSKNIENACIKARRHNLSSNKIFFYLKTQEFKYIGAEIKLNRFSNLPTDLIQVVRPIYKKIYDNSKQYRATGIIIMNLKIDNKIQLDLFADPIKIENMTQILGSLDKISKKYGKHSLFLGSSFKAMSHDQHQGDRAKQADRKTMLFKGESNRKRIGIPVLGKVI
ncbi:MAG: DNA polymerase IV [Candidatus Magasanikbacteria bacterium]|nr:DNA polymerase IV [Candidatus Magasanikbacteria bacterium]